MEIVIDLTYFEYLLTQPVWIIVWELFKNGGWAFLVVVFLIFAVKFWKGWRQEKYFASLEHVLLAIDVPKENLQALKAVELFFSHLSGILSKTSFIDKYWHGEFQKGFSLEVISIDGYIQFLIYTPVEFRDLIEAAVYAQYPDAEITEVADYTENISTIPSEGYELWGTEFVLAEKSAYPIRTYPFFEDKATGDLKDPMAAILEVLSKLRRGEQIWIQLIIAPASDAWKEEGNRIVKKLIGAKIKTKKNILDMMLDIPIKFLEIIGTHVLSSPSVSSSSSAKKEEAPSQIQYLSPGEKDIVAAIEEKISKVGFQTKIRFIYIAKKEIFAKARVAATVGAIRQFNTLNLNAFKTASSTKPGRILKKKGKAANQRKAFLAYRSRDWRKGETPFILNTEELAGLYHFPIITVKAPLVRKTEAKKSEPPFRLPEEEIIERPMILGKENEEDEGPPSNLPVA